MFFFFCGMFSKAQSTDRISLKIRKNSLFLHWAEQPCLKRKRETKNFLVRAPTLPNQCRGKMSSHENVGMRSRIVKWPFFIISLNTGCPKKKFIIEFFEVRQLWAHGRRPRVREKYEVVTVNLSVHLPTFGVAAQKEHSLQVLTILMQPSWFLSQTWWASTIVSTLVGIKQPFQVNEKEHKSSID